MKKKYPRFFIWHDGRYKVIIINPSTVLILSDKYRPYEQSITRMNEWEECFKDNFHYKSIPPEEAVLMPEFDNLI